MATDFRDKLAANPHDNLYASPGLMDPAICQYESRSPLGGLKDPGIIGSILDQTSLIFTASTLMDKSEVKVECLRCS